MTPCVFREAGLHVFLCVLCITSSSCFSKPPLKSTNLPNVTIFASNVQELEAAEEIIEGFSRGVPETLLVDDSIPVQILLLETDSPGEFNPPGLMTETPFFNTKTIRVYGSGWRSLLGHELFHAYFNFSLKGVPQFIQEGLADWFGSRDQNGDPEMRLHRWAWLLEEKRIGFLSLETKSPSLGQEFGCLLSSGEICEPNRRLSFEELIEQTSLSIQHLDQDQVAFLYAVGFAIVEDIATSRPHLLVAEKLKKQSDETTEQYFERLGVPSIPEICARAERKVNSASPTRVFWLSLRRELDRIIRADRSDSRTEAEFMETFRAKINYRGADHELLSDPEFLQLVSEHWFLIHGSEGAISLN